MTPSRATHRARRPRDRSSGRLMWLAALTFAVSFSSGMTGPVFPLHAQALGATYQQIGIVSAAGSLIHAGFASRAGRLADRLGHDLMFLLSSLAIVFSTTAYFFSRTLFLAGLGKALDSLFIASYWPAVESASHSSGSAAGHSLGVVYTVYPVATFAASAVTGWLAGRSGYRASFAAALLGAAAAVVGVSIGLSRSRKLDAGRDHGAARAGRRLRAHGEQPERSAHLLPGSRLRFAAALTACFTYCVLVGEAFTFVPLLAEARGLRVELVGLLVGLFWLGRTATSLPAGMLADRAGADVVLVPAFVVGCMGSAAVAWSATPPVMFVGVAMMGLCAGAVAPVAMVLGAQCVDPESHGWALGLCETFCGIGFISTGLVGGVLAGRHGLAVPFAVGAAVCVTVAIGLALASRRGPSS
ncbi:MAG: putative transporter [Firmicutes bacterium ADurb.BinA052]|nr:MAG: putative transporter [Firmicutes bacterium ADurb.BinA052]